VSDKSSLSPERMLLQYIESHWTLEVENISRCDISFTDKDHNTDNQVYAPTVCVQMQSAQRMPPKYDDWYEFLFSIKVSLWSRWSKLPQDCDIRLLHNQMIDHIKSMFSVYPGIKCPKGWTYAYVDSVTNLALTRNLPPELNAYNLVVRAMFNWKPNPKRD